MIIFHYILWGNLRHTRVGRVPVHEKVYLMYRVVPYTSVPCIGELERPKVTIANRTSSVFKFNLTPREESGKKKTLKIESEK